MVNIPEKRQHFLYKSEERIIPEALDLASRELYDSSDEVAKSFMEKELLPFILLDDTEIIDKDIASYRSLILKALKAYFVENPIVKTWQQERKDAVISGLYDYIFLGDLDYDISVRNDCRSLVYAFIYECTKRDHFTDICELAGCSLIEGGIILDYLRHNIHLHDRRDYVRNNRNLFTLAIDPGCSPAVGLDSIAVDYVQIGLMSRGIHSCFRSETATNSQKEKDKEDEEQAISVKPFYADSLYKGINQVMKYSTDALNSFDKYKSSKNLVQSWSKALCIPLFKYFKGSPSLVCSEIPFNVLKLKMVFDLSVYSETGEITKVTREVPGDLPFSYLTRERFENIIRNVFANYIQEFTHCSIDAIHLENIGFSFAVSELSKPVFESYCSEFDWMVSYRKDEEITETGYISGVEQVDEEQSIIKLQDTRLLDVLRLYLLVYLANDGIKSYISKLDDIINGSKLLSLVYDSNITNSDITQSSLDTLHSFITYLNTAIPSCTTDSAVLYNFFKSNKYKVEACYGGNYIDVEVYKLELLFKKSEYIRLSRGSISTLDDLREVIAAFRKFSSEEEKVNLFGDTVFLDELFMAIFGEKFTK